LIVSVRIVPVLLSRISLRNRSIRDGNGPTVSVGVTAHAAFVDPVVVVVEPAVDGLVGESAPHP
jgi:hypothetical protein